MPFYHTLYDISSLVVFIVITIILYVIYFMSREKAILISNGTPVSCAISKATLDSFWLVYTT